MNINNPKKIVADDDEMLVATVYVKYDPDGTGVFRQEATPAEVVILAAENRKRSKGDPISSIEITGKVTRNRMEELRRLSSRFSIDKVKQAFPNKATTLPTTYEEAIGMANELTLKETDMFILDLANA